MNLYLGLARWAQDVGRRKCVGLTDVLKLHPNLWGVDIPDLHKPGIEPKYIDCCMNNCISFTGEHVNASAGRSVFLTSIAKSLKKSSSISR
jgi:hypothetical protein